MWRLFSKPWLRGDMEPNPGSVDQALDCLRRSSPPEGSGNTEGARRSEGVWKGCLSLKQHRALVQLSSLNG